MIFDFFTKKIKVFVSEASDDVLYLKSNLEKVLESAGMEVLCINNNENIDENNIIIETQKLLNQADCSIHIIGNSFNRINLDNQNISISEYQLQQAQEKINLNNTEFKVFIWHPTSVSSQISDNEQDDFISQIRQSIHHNMIYSNRDIAISFVEDIRSVMYSFKPKEIKTKNSDLFFIYNQLDEESAKAISNLVSDIIDTQTLEIILSEDIDYSELIVQQVKKSKFMVIYYKNTSDWAEPFVKQVWKKTGGASSNVPILFIGDENVAENEHIDFEAPNVTSIKVANDIIPIEIKVQFDSLTENN
ncbi:MAG: hypothetical protein JXR51_14875 [Bacteroidales bacterium]|nr:hypothetical protein [Bacteroidales bacterium]MBN2758454.1 hypothetical protein [Bacteroidales bacterium]